MSDYELLAHLYKHKSPVIRFMYQCFRDRNLPKTGLVIRLKGRQSRERISGKKIKVIGEERGFFDEFAKRSHFKDLEKLETLISHELGIEPHRIVVVPMITPWRFVPEDILYHDDGAVLSLKKTQPEYFDVMRAETDDYVAIRVCVIGDRNIVYKKADKIHQLIKNSK